MLTLGIVILVVILAINYSLTSENFSSTALPVCTFKKLGIYKISTNKSSVMTSGSKGLIYLADNTNWKTMSLDNTSALFSSLDLTGFDVSKTILKVMKCNNIPTNINDMLNNTGKKLILHLQSTSTPTSRQMFINSFVTTSATNSVIYCPPQASNLSYGSPMASNLYTLSYYIMDPKNQPTTCTSPNLDNPITTSNLIAADTACSSSPPPFVPGTEDKKSSSGSSNKINEFRRPQRYNSSSSSGGTTLSGNIKETAAPFINDLKPTIATCNKYYTFQYT
jgi:hypothetical protein